MRRFLIYTLSLLTLTLLLGACKRETIVLYGISVESLKHCTYAEQDVTITFKLQQPPQQDPEQEPVVNSIIPIVTTDADWVSVTTTTSESVTLHVLANEGNKRSAKITIAASGYKSTTVTLSQFRTPPAEANHTLMYYFLGNSLNRYFKTNLKDAGTAIEKGILGNSNRVVFFRQESASRGYIGELCFDGGMCLEQRLAEIEIPNSVVTYDFVGQCIAEMANYAPAKRYGIVCAGHGQAWIPREVLDNDSDIAKASLGYTPWQKAPGAEVTRAYGEKSARIDIPELALAIEDSGVSLDYIIFDACFMSNIEVLYDLRNVANYIIASPCEIMGDGFPYDMTLPYLFTDNGNTTDYVRAAESYHIYYRDVYNNSARSGSITLIDCEEIEALAEATKRVVATATDDYDPSKLQTYEGEQVHHFYDFGQWVRTIATDSEALEAFNTQYEKCVVETYTLNSFYTAYGSYGSRPIDLEAYSGITTSAPSEAYPNAWRKTNWYNYVWGE